MEGTAQGRGKLFNGLLRRHIDRLESRIRGERELLWHPRLELAAARELGQSRRRLALLRSMSRGANH